MTAGRGVQKTVGFLLLFIAVVLSLFVYSSVRDRPMSREQLKELGFYQFERPRLIPEFSLLETDQTAFELVDLQGQWSLLFFGFTFCPDVCPTTMSLLSEWHKQLDAELAKETRVILVTVDPARDSVDKLAEYIAYFNPSFRGVSGEFLDLHRFATRLNIPFAKIPGGGESYQVEHSGNIVLVNPRGHYVGFFKTPHDSQNMLKAYQSLRADYR